MTRATDNSVLLRVDAFAAVDAPRTHPAPSVSPASVLVECVPSSTAVFPTRLLACGTPEQVNAHEAARSPRLRTLQRPTSILLPGLVNAHTHLDLTHIGPQPHNPADGFVPWVDMIRSRRETDPARIAASVQQGIALSLMAGTVAIGDIAGAPRGQLTLQPFQTLRSSPLVGVTWLEFFGMGTGLQRSTDMLNRLLPEITHGFEQIGGTNSRVRLGLQPHAPNTVAPALFRLAITHALRLGHAAPLSTHLAETPEEREFIAHASGPQRRLLEQLGLWDDSILQDLGRGNHPVAHLADLLALAPFTVAHVNDAPDAAIATLASTNTRVVYCPRASAYFHAERHFGPHRYQAMLAAGIPVALGTDSIVNLPPNATGPGGRGLSILDEMRFLFARDHTNPITLLQMATTNGALALGLDPAAFTFTPGHALAGLLAVPLDPRAANTPEGRASPMNVLLEGSESPELLFASTISDMTAIN